MTNPLKLIDIFGNQEVMLDIMRCADSLFNYDQHREYAIVNAKQIYDSVDQNERDNVFGIYGNDSFVGITGVWYDENPVLKGVFVQEKPAELMIFLTYLWCSILVFRY